MTLSLRDKIKVGLVFAGVMFLIGIMVWAMVWTIVRDKNELKICADDLGLKYNPDTSNFTNKYINENSFACCWKESRFVSSEGGVFEEKCYSVHNKEGGTK